MPDEQPPDLDGPDDPQQPPDMPEPPDNAPAVSRPEKPLFARAPAPPVGASPLMAYILSVVTDPTLRREIEQAAWSLNAGLDEDHLLTKAAALLTAVQQAHIGRAALILSENRRILNEMRELLTDLDTTLAERDARTQPEPADAEGEQPGQTVQASAPGLDMNALRGALRAETNSAIHAAFRAGSRATLMVLGSGVLLGLLLAYLIHIL